MYAMQIEYKIYHVESCIAKSSVWDIAFSTESQCILSCGFVFLLLRKFLFRLCAVTSGLCLIWAWSNGQRWTSDLARCRRWWDQRSQMMKTTTDGSDGDLPTYPWCSDGHTLFMEFTGKSSRKLVYCKRKRTVDNRSYFDSNWKKARCLFVARGLTVWKTLVLVSHGSISFSSTHELISLRTNIYTWYSGEETTAYLHTYKRSSPTMSSSDEFISL